MQTESSGHPLLLRDLRLEVMVARIQTDFSFPTDNMLFRLPKNWLKTGWKGRSEGQGEWTSCTHNRVGASHWGKY